MKPRKFMPRSLTTVAILILALMSAASTALGQHYRAKILLAHYDGVMAIAASTNLDDRYLIALVATRNGDVHELYYTESAKGGDSVIAHYDGIVGIAGFYNKDDQYRVAIIATNDGDVHEVYYHPNKGRGESVIGHFPGITAVAGFFADDDQNRIVIVATRDGEIHEIFYNPNRGRSESIITHQDGVVAISANYGSSAHADDRSVVLLTNNHATYRVLYHPTRGLVKQEFLPNNGTISIASNAQEIFVVNGSGQLLGWANNTTIGEEIPGGVQRLETIAVGYENGVNLVGSTRDGYVYFLAPQLR